MAQRVLITAGASGIGKEVARTFVANGATVCVCDIDGCNFRCRFDIVLSVRIRRYLRTQWRHANIECDLSHDHKFKRGTSRH